MKSRGVDFKGHLAQWRTFLGGCLEFCGEIGRPFFKRLHLSAPNGCIPKGDRGVALEESSANSP